MTKAKSYAVCSDPAKPNEGRLLAGKKELLGYLDENGCSLGNQALDTLIRAGLPGARIGGRLYFHTRHVDEFLLRITRQKVSPEEDGDSQ